jgi:CTP:molybdopterin cytidylyltransferase MocA
MRIAALILAAGQSRRFGQDKRQAHLPAGTTMLDAVLALYAQVFAPVLVVVRPGDDAFALAAAQRHGATPVVCEQADLGMGHSLATGAQAVLALGPDVQGVVIGLADMPAVQSLTLLALKQALMDASSGASGGASSDALRAASVAASMAASAPAAAAVPVGMRPRALAGMPMPAQSAEPWPCSGVEQLPESVDQPADWPCAQAVLPVYQGQAGHPRGLPRAMLAPLLDLRGDQGARHVIDWSQARQVAVDDLGILVDIDQAQDLARLRPWPP